MSINRTVLQGRLTRNPELRRTPNGTAVCTFTIAWSEKIKEHESKVFLTCVAWDKNAEFVSNYFAKGQEVVAEGRLATRKFTDKEGRDREVTEMTLDRIHFCGPKQQHAPIEANDFSDMPVDDGDLPF